MAEEETAGIAEGNANAQLYTFAAAEPEVLPFPNVLTPEQEDRHFYFNDDILDIAEDIDLLLQEQSQLQDIDLPRVTRLIAEIEMPAGFYDRASLIAQRDSINQRISGIDSQIHGLEADILQELVIIRGEYEDKAYALEQRREAFTQDYEVHQNQIQGMQNAREIEMRVDPEDVYYNERRLENVNGSRLVHIERYENTYADYRLLEEGFSITTLREVFSNLVWGAAILVVTEIVTGGVAKFVIIAGRSATTAVAATRIGGRLMNVGTAIAARYNALSYAARARLDRLRRTRRVDEPDRPQNNGLADDAVEEVADDVPLTCVLCP